MPDYNLQNATQTDMANTDGLAFSPDSETLDDSNEVYYVNSDFDDQLTYYKSIPELYQAINAVARWTCGRGWTASARDKAILERISGWGEDTIDSIFMSMIIAKKFSGDAYSEIIRGDDLEIINIKPLNPKKMRIVTNKQGVIIRYEEINVKTKKAQRSYKPNEIFHISENRICNENHGTSVLKACKFVIDARNEAMESWRRVLHRSSVRIAYIDADDSATLNRIKTDYPQAIKHGELMIVPGKKGECEIVDYPVPPAQPYMDTIRYYENFFYQAVGCPKSILGGTQDFTEASSKMSVFTFDQVWMTEQRLLEQDILKQLGLRVKFERPTSLKDDVVANEAANTGQMGVQPSETQAGVTRNE